MKHTAASKWKQTVVAERRERARLSPVLELSKMDDCRPLSDSEGTPMQPIKARLAEYPEFLRPLREAAERYVEYESVLTNDGVMLIANRPWVAPKNYMFRLFPGLTNDQLKRYCQTFGVQVPDLYAEFLYQTNGAFCFGMSLCGVPASMLGNPPLLNRDELQCHDLAIAVNHWIRSYRVPNGLFHFGSRHLSYTENLGYFIKDDRGLLAAKADGTVVGEWPNFTDFLASELQASERLEEQLHPQKREA
jgi:hypothetical protein